MTLDEERALLAAARDILRAAVTVEDGCAICGADLDGTPGEMWATVGHYPGCAVAVLQDALALADGAPGDGIGRYSEIVTLNGTQYGAFVDRAKRQIIFHADVVIAPSDRLVVPDMTGAIEAVEHDEHGTVVTLGWEPA